MRFAIPAPILISKTISYQTKSPSTSPTIEEIDSTCGPDICEVNYYLFHRQNIFDNKTTYNWTRTQYANPVLNQEESIKFINANCLNPILSV